MNKISTDQIQELRKKTGVGLMEAKKALESCDGDMEQSINYLVKRGEKITLSKANRTTNQGIIDTYIHNNHKVAGVVSLLCETDFVARTDEFKELAHEIALQVAATRPEYLVPEDIPDDVIKKEKENYETQVDEGKPKDIKEKIIEGKLNSYYKEACLMNQPYIKDDSITVEELINQKVSSLGENIKVKEFAFFEI